MKKCVLMLILAGLSISVAGQGNERLTNEAEGYSFVAPKGWKSNTSAEGHAFVDPGQNIILAVKPHTYRDQAAFMADAGLDRDGLELVGEQQNIPGGKVFRTVKRGPQGMAVIDTAVVYRSTGGGLVVVSITDERNSNTGFETAVAVAGTVEFHQPKASAVGEQVTRLLSGKHLIYLYTGNGYSERKDIVLCGSGIFYQSTDMGGFSPGNVDGGSFSARGTKSGRWSVGTNGGSLILQFNNGANATFRISARQASNEIGLNGQRFFVQQQNFCK